MKRILSLLLALALCLPLCACGNQKEAEAAQKAKEAYDFLVEAYTKTDEIGSAIYGCAGRFSPRRPGAAAPG